MKILTYWELAEQINQMPLDERAKPAVILDENTGEFVGITGIEHADPSEDGTPPYLKLS